MRKSLNYALLLAASSLVAGCSSPEDPAETAVKHFNAMGAGGLTTNSPMDKALVFLGVAQGNGPLERVDPNLRSSNISSVTDREWLKQCGDVVGIRATSQEIEGTTARIRLELENKDGQRFVVPEVLLKKSSERWYITGVTNTVSLKTVIAEGSPSNGSLADLRTADGKPVFTGRLREVLLQSSERTGRGSYEDGPLVKNPVTGKDVPAYIVKSEQVSVCIATPDKLTVAAAQAEQQKTQYLAEAKAAESFYLEKLALKKELEAAGAAIHSELQGVATGLSQPQAPVVPGAAAAGLLASARPGMDRARADLQRMRTIGPQEVLSAVKRYYEGILKGDLAAAAAQWEGAANTAPKEFDRIGVCSSPGFSKFSPTTPMFVPDSDPLQVGHLLVKVVATSNCTKKWDSAHRIEDEFKFALTADGKWRRL